MKKLNTILITGLVALAACLQAYTPPKDRTLETRAIKTLQALNPSQVDDAYRAMINVLWKNDHFTPQEALDYFVTEYKSKTAVQVIEAFYELEKLAVEVLGQATVDDLNKWRGDITVDGTTVTLEDGPYIRGEDAGFVNPTLMDKRKISKTILGLFARITNKYTSAAENLWIHPWEHTYTDELDQTITETVYPPTPQEVFDFAVENSTASAADLHTFYQGLETLVSIWDPENEWLAKAGTMQLNEDDTVTLTLPDPDAQ